MDFTKLTPVDRTLRFNGRGIERVDGGRLRDEDCDFHILARNAFDVMMRLSVFPVQVREGWSVWCITPHGWPACLFGVVKSGMQFTPSKWPGPWPDPFTALVEADAWYKANVEDKA